MAYAGPDPQLSSGTIRDNLLTGLRRPPVDVGSGNTPAERRRRLEAAYAGTPDGIPDEN
jgi:hypothetical protein